KKPDENVGFDPVAVSLEHGVPFAKKGGQIAPRAPRPDHPQHCFNEQPIVLAASTRVRRLAQTMRLHLRPLGVSQNESFHPKLESQTSFPWNPESQQTLVPRHYFTCLIAELVKLPGADNHIDLGNDLLVGTGRSARPALLSKMRIEL